MENRTPPQRPNIPPRPNIPQKPNIPQRPNIPPRPTPPSSVNLEKEESLQQKEKKPVIENVHTSAETNFSAENISIIKKVKTEIVKEKKKPKEKRALGEGSKRALKLLLAGVSFLGAVACFVFLFI